MAVYAEDIMRSEVVTVKPDTTVADLVRLLASHQISGVPVVTEEGEIVGVVSTTDVIRLGAEAGEWATGSFAWEPLLLAAEDFEEESAAPFFMAPEEWRAPLEGSGEEFETSSFEGYTVADIMTPAAFTIRPQEKVEDVARFLLRGRIHRALVVEDGKLKGIVTAFDLLRAFVGDVEASQ